MSKQHEASNDEHSTGACCGGSSCNPSSGGRRDFIKATGLTAAMLAAGPGKLMAGPFSAENMSGHVPIDKKLAPGWVASLTQRGLPEVFSGDELRYIGMPVGGVGCGQLYLGGDGRLWHWDIFKSNYRGEYHVKKLDLMTFGGHYAHPVAFGAQYSDRHGAEVQQGFAIRVKSGEQSFVRTLDQKGFLDVSFRGEYPVGRVTYEDTDFPVKVELEAFSPFIPLNTKDSSLPVTVMRYTVTNSSNSAVDVDLGGWLQNAVCPYTEDSSLGKRSNQFEKGEGRVSIHSTIDGAEAIAKEHGYGSSALTILEDEGLKISGATSLDSLQLFEELDRAAIDSVSKSLDEPLIGALGASMTLKPGATRVITCLVSWYFPLHQGKNPRGITFCGRHYGPWFQSAADVADYVAQKQSELIDGTLLWNQTWYDSSLPHWFLDRSMISLDCLATQTYHWFDNGLPWAWEGVDCCPGSCTHVFHYAQGLSRIFPELERVGRERVDYDLAFTEEAGIGYRGSISGKIADDGQAGVILRVYREHQMSTDDAFLKRLWPRVKQSIEYLMAKDPDEDGILTGAQPHTLDAEWTGKIAWISSMYLGALAAGEAMAQEVGDDAFAAKCRGILDRGYKQIVSDLFDGEYFIHKPNKALGKHINTNIGCHIDQVLGQFWAHQVGLGRILPKEETVSALESLWKYNFSPDAGGYALKNRVIEKAFRWYAMEGEAGLLMTTWPKGGAKDAIPGSRLRSVENPDTWMGPGGYFNECMNGFEYQVAAHMVSEGDPDSPLVEKGLAVMRAVHDRYGAAKRNPYNEIECSDHYIRSMASYGIFLSACGFSYHGPKGAIGFAPKIHPDNFKAPFTAAEGWGTYSQQKSGKSMDAQLQLKWGRLKLKTLQLAPNGFAPKQVDLRFEGQPVAAEIVRVNDRAVIQLAEAIEVTEGTLEVKLS